MKPLFTPVEYNDRCRIHTKAYNTDSHPAPTRASVVDCSRAPPPSPPCRYPPHTRRTRSQWPPPLGCARVRQGAVEKLDRAQRDK
eukprot:5327532-Prymnesium_polylepis.1